MRMNGVKLCGPSKQGNQSGVWLILKEHLSNENTSGSLRRCRNAPHFYGSSPYMEFILSVLRHFRIGWVPFDERVVILRRNPILVKDYISRLVSEHCPKLITKIRLFRYNRC